MATVKTYRAKMQQNVGGNQRQVGDYIPEAASWHHSVLATYVRAGFVEETYVDSDELDQALLHQRANDGVVHGEHEAPEDEDPALTPEDDESVIEDEEVEDENPEPVQQVKLKLKKG
jgi:hypothetical protein